VKKQLTHKQQIEVLASLAKSIKKRELELANWPEIFAGDPRFIAVKEHLVEVLRRNKMIAEALDEIW
jgi:hypothetical protein